MVKWKVNEDGLAFMILGFYQDFVRESDGFYTIEKNPLFASIDYHLIVEDTLIFTDQNEELVLRFAKELGLRPKPTWQPNRDGLAWKMLSECNKNAVESSDGMARIEDTNINRISLYLKEGDCLGGFHNLEAAEAFAEDLGLEVVE